MSTRNSTPNIDCHATSDPYEPLSNDAPRRSGTHPMLHMKHNSAHGNTSPKSESLSLSQQKDFLKVSDLNGSMSGLCRLSNSERKKSASLMLQSEPRETWGKKADFLLSVIGFAVDLANVWRFPYLCYKNGGGAFLVPYILMLLFGGIPLFYMELALGQYIRKGAITCWGRVCPLFKGVGFTVVMIAFYTDFFYNVLIAMSLYYFLSSFTTNLPWIYCGNSWNTPTCYDEHLKDCSDPRYVNLSYCRQVLEEGLAKLYTNSSNTRLRLVSSINGSLYNTTPVATRTYPADEFYKYAVLGRSNMTNLENIGGVQWHLSTCLLIVYIICYFSLWKGISMSGKVVWFTALFPYIVLFILFFRGITLDGASTGIKYYITPNMSTLATATPWVDAATQVFFSLGPGFGVLLAFASYNPFHNNVYRDALITSAVNSGTSFLSGFVVFSVLGYMAKKRGMEVRDVISDGDPNLVFTVYPEALATLPGSTFWSVNFFLMLLTLGLDSSFGGSEAILTALGDEFPILKRRREVFLGFLLLFYYCIGLTEITQGGIYIFNLFERYCVTYSILIAVFIETFCVSWIYGVDRFRENIREMTGVLPGIYWKLCWKYIAPLFIMCNCIYGLVSHNDLELDGYVYPRWANVIGWLLAMSSIAFIPLVGIFQIIKAPANTFKEKFQYVLTPFADHIHKEEIALASTLSLHADMDHMLPDVRVQIVENGDEAQLEDSA